MDGERFRLQMNGYAPGMANGAVEWAYESALSKVNPTIDPNGFLRELDGRLAKCENWAKGMMRGLAR